MSDSLIVMNQELFDLFSWNKVRPLISVSAKNHAKREKVTMTTSDVSPSEWCAQPDGTITWDATTSLRCKKVFMMHSALFQHNWSRSLPLSFSHSITISAGHRAHPSITHYRFACTQAAQRDGGFVSFDTSQGIHNFFHEFRVQYTWAWAVYLYQKQTGLPYI